MSDTTDLLRPAPTRRAEIAAGLRSSFAAGLGMVPIGVAFGMIVAQSGLPFWIAPALSVVVFAGSLELLLVGMMVVGTPLAAIALTTLLVNGRHAFYAVTFPLGAVRGRLARAYAVYALIDEAYAVTAARRSGWSTPRLLAMQAAFQCYWVGGGLVGLLVASVVPGVVHGLEFSLCALFVTLTLDAVRERAAVPSLLLGGMSFSVALVLVPEQAMLVGLAGFLALLVVRHVLTRAPEERTGA